ncbi:hypothetical protein Tco_0290762 [Tanacetum coccineum]
MNKCDETEEFHSIKETTHLKTRELSIRQFLTSIYIQHFPSRYPLKIFISWLKPMCAADRVVALTLGSTITIPETANEFSIKGNHLTLVKGNQFDGNIIKIFYHGLSKITQEVKNAAAGGIFLYKTPNQAYQLLEDKVLLKLDWAKNQKTKSSLKKTVALADEGSINSDTDKTMARMDAMTLKMDAQYKELQSNAKKQNPILMKMTYPCLVKKRLNSCKLFESSLILGRPFLHTADAVNRVKQKQLNLGVGTERMIFNIDSAMKYSCSNDDTCFSIDVIDEILEKDFDALLDEEPPFKKITINTDYKIKTSLEEPPTDLELKPLPDNLEYVFLEEPSFLPVIISSQLSKEDKNKLVSVLKNHKEAFAWKTTDIPGIFPSFCKHKIQLLDDKKPIVQKQRRLSPNMQEVVKKEIVKLLDTGIIYLIADSPWVSPIHYVPKKGGITVVTNENNELVPTRTVTGWREKCHFMVKEGIVLGHKVSSAGLEVDKAKIDVISKLPPPTNIKAQALPTNNARVVVTFLKKLFCRFGMPKALISDRDNPAIWSRKLDDAIWLRTAYKTPTGTTPYKLIYGKNCHLPFEIEHRAYWALKNCNPDLIAAEFIMSRTNTQATIVSGEQLVPRVNRLVIKKNNQRVTSDLDIIDTMLRFVVEILKHHKLYKPVSLTATIPIIYLHQFWTTINHNANNHTFTFELDTHTFTLTPGLLRTVLQMSPPNHKNTYTKRPSINQILGFIKTLGYDEDPDTKISVVSKMSLQDIGIIHSANLDFASLIWDEFEWKTVYKSSRPSKMSKLLYIRFTKLIINHFPSCNNSDYKFGIEIPDTMISDEIKKSAGYNYYIAKKKKNSEYPKKDVVSRKTRSLTITKEIVVDTNNDAILYSTCLNTTEESANETDDADDSDMDLSDDNLQGNDDAAGFGEMFPDENAHHKPSLPVKKIPYNATTPHPSSLQAKVKKLMQKEKKNMRKINFKKAVA